MGDFLLFNWLNDDGEQNDEVCRITLNGEPVITTTHDDEGWDGMTGIIEALTTVAHLQGWTIEVKGESGV